MSTVVVQLAMPDLQKLAQTYQAYQVPNKDPGKLHFFKVRGTAISTYKSGKVLFQGALAQELASQWQPAETGPAGQRSRSTAALAAKSAIDNGLTTIGSDEVGNGSYFGGLAVVASLVVPSQHSKLRELGVDDSKNLTDNRIRQIAPILQEAIDHQALLLSPSKYNEIIPSRYNAVSVKVALHNQAIYLLLQKTAAPQQIVIDSFTSERNYEKYLSEEVNRFPNPVCLVEKAESKCLAVAVSSIIARAMFLEQLDKLSQNAGFRLPSGAGAAADKTAARLLQEADQDLLRQTAKLHFKNTQRARQLARRQ